VYDLDSVQVMGLVQGLNNGRDLAGNKLDGSTAFTIGAAVTPEAELVGPVLAKFEVKVKAGAQFFQTQAIYNTDQFASFMNAVRPFKVKVLAGILLLRNAKMAEFMNANIPGMSVPQAMIDELRAAGDKSEDVGVEIAVRSIQAVRPHCDGVHIMARIGSEKLLPRANSHDDRSRSSALQARQEKSDRGDRVRRAFYPVARAGRH
jgi:5,10-methylenetetrahydrofolate reductase